MTRAVLRGRRGSGATCHLIRAGLRTKCGLVVETGEARQVHDFCLLAGYGAEGVGAEIAFVQRGFSGSVR